MTEEIEKGDVVRFNPTQYIFEKRLTNRGWGTLCGHYHYRVITLGRKWATLRLVSRNTGSSCRLKFGKIYQSEETSLKS